MCGIAGGWGVDDARVRAGIAALQHRGPDASRVVARGNAVLGHARLSIVDVGERSHQPFVFGDIALVYNGELWNMHAVRSELAHLGAQFATTSDTEVVAAALYRWGTGALSRLDGMFAMAWHDGKDGRMHLARDRFGEIPLHVNPQARVFASEAKAMRAMGIDDWAWLPPGHMMSFGDDVRWSPPQSWYYPSAVPVARSIESAAPLVRRHLENGTASRTISDVPVCTLLSGGIDSTIIALHLKRHIPNLVAYTAVMNPRSRDLRCARAAAEMIGVELREVPVAPPTADDLAEVVRLIEQPHKAQVEIGWACLALARRMREDGFKVTFSGEGSDELWASYGFAHHGVIAHGWHEYRRKLFLDQHRKNFARCNKVFMAHSVECRLPFLERGLVELALSLPRDAVEQGTNPKAVLAHAYDGDLPEEILRRPKVAFQDGMGLKAKAADAVRDPKRFYLAEYNRSYGGTKP